jgi:hypothetical protein
VYSTSAGHVKILFHFIKPTPETDSRGILTHDLMVSGFDLGKSTRETRYCCIKLCEDASPAAAAPLWVVKIRSISRINDLGRPSVTCYVARSSAAQCRA